MNVSIHPSAVIEEGVSIGNNAQIWHFCHLMPGSSVGERTSLGQNVFLDCDVKIGNGVKVQNNVSVYKGVIIEDEVFIGPSAVFTNVINPRSFIDRKHEIKETIVRKGATIGANSTIVCGVEIGAYAFVGAGAVVISNILPNALVTGNPARQIGWVSEAGNRLNFKKGCNVAECPLTRDRYVVIEKKLVKVAES